MQLTAYRKLRNITQEQAADEIGVRGLTIYRWESGDRTPRMKEIKRVYDWSNGAVQANDWLEHWVACNPGVVAL